MAPSDVSICNLALARVGQRQTIASLAEATTQARLCAPLYPQTRDAMLGESPWLFATARSVLTADPLEERSGWANVCPLPSDCLYVQRVESAARPGRLGVPPTPFAVEGTWLLCDEEAPELVYTARVPEAGFPALFVDALAWRLAGELALSLAVKPSLAGAISQAYEVSRARALAAEFRQVREDPRPESAFISGRW